jgi:hypothetical protein
VLSQYLPSPGWESLAAMTVMTGLVYLAVVGVAQTLGYPAVRQVRRRLKSGLSREKQA